MSNILPLLPRLTVNRSFMSAFLAAPVLKNTSARAGSWSCVQTRSSRRRIHSLLLLKIGRPSHGQIVLVRGVLHPAGEATSQHRRS